MFIGANAATYNWHCQHQKGFVSAGDHKHRVELNTRELRLSPRWNELAQDALHSLAPCRTEFGEIMAFDALHEAYPNMAKLPVELTQTPIDASRSVASVTVDLLTRHHIKPGQSKPGPADVFAHEIQHIVQAVEGFSAGSNIADEFQKQAALWLSELKDGKTQLTGSRYVPQPVGISAKQQDRLTSFCAKIARHPQKYLAAERVEETGHPACQEFLKALQTVAAQNYYFSAGEVEAFETMRRRRWTPEDRIRIKPQHSFHLHDMQYLTGDCYGVLYEPRSASLTETTAIARHALIPAKPEAAKKVSRAKLLLRLLFGVRQHIHP